VLERATIRTDGVYLLYNCFTIYIYIGRRCDPFFIYELFRVTDLKQVDKEVSEDEIFSTQDQSSYMKALAGIVQQIRDQRQPFAEI
jgi:hypothetical protein